MRTYKQVDDKIELCIPPDLEPELKKIFGSEMQYGFQGVLTDGRIHYRFSVSEEKAYLLQQVSDILGYDPAKSRN